LIDGKISINLTSSRDEIKKDHLWRLIRHSKCKKSLHRHDLTIRSEFWSFVRCSDHQF
jgi:hypothetical protein